MSNFKLGDKVRIKSKKNSGEYLNKEGTLYRKCGTSGIYVCWFVNMGTEKDLEESPHFFEHDIEKL